MEWTIRVDNPSGLAHRGPVIVPWEGAPEAVKSAPARLALFDPSDVELEDPLPVQLDALGARGGSGYVLAFRLTTPIEPGATKILRLKQAEPRSRTNRWFPDVATGWPERIDLFNQGLFVSFSLAPRQLGRGPSCYAGSAQSVRLRDREFLEPWAVSWDSHDAEKRCMQVDRLTLFRDGAKAEHNLFAGPYQVISNCWGPVRSVFSLARLLPPTDSAEPCWVHRVLSLPDGADYVVDEVFLRAGSPENGPMVECGHDFSVRYFANMDMFPLTGPGSEIFSSEPHWFVIGHPYGDPSHQCPGYGFASSARVASVAHPHPGFPAGVSLKHRTFSWELGSSRGARCIHVFMRNPDFEHFKRETGRLWHQHIHKPLDATVVPA